MLALATALYLGNCGLGVAAQVSGRSFGWLHHAAYAAVFASAIGATLFVFHPALLVTLLALLVFPRTRPRTVAHPLLAAIGALGYAAAWIG